jgi:hypothetical protein
MANVKRCWPEEYVCGQKHIFGQFEKIFLQSLPLNWITANWISQLIESDWQSPGRTGLNIYKNHWLIESKSHLIASLFQKISHNFCKFEWKFQQNFKNTSKNNWSILYIWFYWILCHELQENGQDWTLLHFNSEKFKIM